jgi:glutathione S-transferase
MGEMLEVYRSFFIGAGPFIGGAAPSIADMRLTSILEFLPSIDYPFPAWTRAYMAAVEKALGAAYSEPVADVRGYIQYVKSQRK